MSLDPASARLYAPTYGLPGRDHARGGQAWRPCIRGLPMTVSDVLDYLASGMSEDDILRDCPDLTRDDIRACLAFAADRERRVMRPNRQS